MLINAHPTSALPASLGNVHPPSQHPTNHGLLFLFPQLLTHPLPTAQLGMEHSPERGAQQGWGTAGAGGWDSSGLWGTARSGAGLK